LKATRKGGRLLPIDECYIWSEMPAAGPLYSKGDTNYLYFDNIPDVSDKKSAKYNDETGIGRTAPFKIYSNSENRGISCECHFFVQQASGPQSAKAILDTMRWLQAHVYPKEPEGGTYIPPPIMQIKLFKNLSEEPLCVILTSYNTKFDPSVPWDEEYGIPYKLDISLEFEVVYQSENLPYAEDIKTSGGA